MKDTNSLFSEYPDLVTVIDLTKMLHIGKNSAYTLLKNKEIQSIMVFGKRLIPKKEIVRYVNERLK